MKGITVHSLQKILDNQFGGGLACGCHRPDVGACCALELLSVAKKQPWTFSVVNLETWSFNRLNDYEDDLLTKQLRTQALLPLLAAFADVATWRISRQIRILDQALLLTSQRLISQLPWWTTSQRQQWRRVNSPAQLDVLRLTIDRQTFSGDYASNGLRRALQHLDFMHAAAQRAVTSMDCEIAADYIFECMRSVLFPYRQAWLKCIAGGPARRAPARTFRRHYKTACQIWLDAKTRSGQKRVA